MGQRFLEWLSAILVICCVPVFGQDCGNTTYNGTTGTINLVDAGKGKNCTYYIVAGNSAPQVAIIFPAASLDPSIYNLTVYAGNETTSPVISNLTQVLPGQPFVVVISSYNVTKIVLSHGDKEGTAPSLAVTYNTTGCLAPAQSIGGIFPSPYYLPNNGTVNCTYIGTVQAQRLGVLSFTKMNVTSGKVDVKFGSSNLTPVITGTTVPADMFGAVDATITLNFTFDSKTDVQSFQAIFQSVSPDCSGVKTASSGLTKLAIPQSNQLPVTCYTRIEAPDNNQVYITDGGKYTQATGIDSIVYFDGSNTNSSVIGSVSDGFSWHVSSGKYLTIIASLRAQGSRTTDIQYKSDASSKYYQVTDKTAVVVDGATAKGSQVSLTFASQNSSLGNFPASRYRVYNLEFRESSTGQKMNGWGPVSSAEHFQYRASD